LPPIFIGLFSATYAILTIIAFYKNGSQFNAILSSNGGDITSNRFIRLMCLASFEVLFNIPIALYFISLQAQVPLNPYISWDNVHFNFSDVQEIPSIIWRSNYSEEIAEELSRWSVVFCAFGFFMFFGFADEARKNYRYAFQSVAKRVGLSTTGSSSRSGIDSYYYGSDGYVKLLY
jgi:pheromone a factor receptor